MVLHIVTKEEEIEELPEVVRTEVAEEVSKLVVVSHNNLDKLTDLIPAEEKAIIRVR